jgi:hypothetical protein
MLCGELSMNEYFMKSEFCERRFDAQVGAAVKNMKAAVI